MSFGYSSHPPPVTHPLPLPHVSPPHPSILHHKLVATSLLCPRSLHSLGASGRSVTAGAISPPIWSQNFMCPSCQRSIVLMEQYASKLGTNSPRMQERILPTVAYPHLTPSNADGLVVTLSKTGLMESFGRSISKATGRSLGAKMSLQVRDVGGMGVVP